MYESTFPPKVWEREKRRVGLYHAWPAAMFARRPGAPYPVNPVDVNVFPRAAAAAGWAPAHGSWVLCDGVPTPRAQQPHFVYADVRHLAGRVIRNPAFRVHKNLRVIPPSWS